MGIFWSGKCKIKYYVWKDIGLGFHYCYGIWHVLYAIVCQGWILMPPLLSVWPWVEPFSSQWLNFLICKVWNNDIYLIRWLWILKLLMWFLISHFLNPYPLDHKVLLVFLRTYPKPFHLSYSSPCPHSLWPPLFYSCKTWSPCIYTVPPPSHFPM